jgi:autotransporter-associated beta strand protein
VRDRRGGSTAALRTALLASSAFCVTALITVSAAAQNATWLANPGSSDFDTSTNWSPAVVPTATAFFDTSSQTTLSFSANTTIGGWTFNAGASSYTFSSGADITFTGTGIVINGGGAAITNNSLLRFLNSSTAGSASITNNGTGTVNFNDSSTAGGANITNEGLLNFNNAASAGSAFIANDGNLNFSGTSTAGNAQIDVGHPGNVVFSGSSTAGNAIINSGGVIIFENNSSADHANIGNGFDTFFRDNSTAGNAAIVNNSFLTFSNDSSAGIANITNLALMRFSDASTAGSTNINTSSDLEFQNNSSASNATITNTANLSFSNTSTAGSASITNAATGTVNFNDTGTAGSAHITNEGLLNFNNAASAGSAFIANDGNLNFSGTSTAGNAQIDLGHPGNVVFSGSSTAGNAIVNSGGVIIFENNSSADHANIGNGFDTFFSDNSTAGNATIVNNSVLTFSNNSSAGSANITNLAFMRFSDASTAGSATITTSGVFSRTVFSGTSSGGSARLIAQSGGVFDFSGLTSSGTTAGSIEGDGSFLLGAKTLTVGSNNLPTQVSGVIADGGASGGAGGALVKVGTGTLTLTGSNTYSGGTTINAGTLAIAADGNLGAATGALTFGGGTLQFLAGFSTSRAATLNTGGGTIDTNGNHDTLAGSIGGIGSLTKIGTGILELSGNNSYGGGTTIVGGTLQANRSTALGTGAVTFTGTASTLVLNNADLANAIVLGSNVKATIDALGPGALDGAATLGANSTLVLNPGNGGLNHTLFLANSTVNIDPSARIDIQGGVAPSTAAGAALLGGSVNIGAAGRLDLNNQNVAISVLTGSGNITSSASSQTLAVGSGSFSGTITNTGAGLLSLTKFGSGTLALTGNESYSGSTTVNGGILEVDGTIANTTSVTVNSGGTLSGIGLIDPPTITVMNGGALAPGNAANPTGTLTIAGNLAFQSGALYLVQVAGSAAAKADVSGPATLSGGTVNVQFAAGGPLKNQYTILTAAGGLNGTSFAGLTNTNLPAGVTDSLSYSGNSVFLDLMATMGAGTPLNQNQQNVANAINNFFNGGGMLPANFANLLGLSGGNLANALTQLDGEAATGTERAAFQLTNEFLGLMLDPTVNGRGQSSLGGPAIAFAPDQEASLPPDIALAYASVFHKAPPKPPTFDQRWTAWGAAYGGSNRANGNAAIGSTDTATSTFGFAGGMDYHFTPNTVAGVALAGGGTHWGLANALGTGRSDALQVGAYGVSWFGSAYIAGALSFSNHWFTTNRAAIGDQLTANFTGQSYGARLETGRRYAVRPAFAVTPYAAVQYQDLHTPAYNETDATGGGFGIAYNAKNATDVRTELGARFDNRTLLGDRPLILFGRLAWAHDFVDNPALSAAFETLPGSAFTVNGAPIPHDSALTSAGAELFLTPQWTLLTKFEGEFASGSQTYAGTATLRHTW